ncbi:hypothetical protein HQQ80_00655 [Microbacteriaceae bacterium VKM Ac-2855]|nr:hypothetical protein [Microbacteriaceae bacterium VKM Ac-2855]
MKASPAQQRELLTLQSLDTLVRQLDRQAQTLPQIAQIQAMKEGDDTSRRTLAGLVGELEDSRTELKRMESDVEVVEKRMARDQDRLASSSSTKDIAALEGEIAALRKRRGDLEDIELTIMERIESLEEAASAAQTARDDIVAAIAALAEARDGELVVLADKKAALARDRESLVATLDPELVALYEKQRARYGIGAGLLRGKVSEGSGMALTESDLSWIRRAPSEDVIICPDSGCILVRTEESQLI